jgi:hypothetical protein
MYHAEKSPFALLTLHFNICVDGQRKVKMLGPCAETPYRDFDYGVRPT